MQEFTTSAAVVLAAIVEEAWQEVGASFERFCLTAGVATLATMMAEDAARLCGRVIVVPRAGGRPGQSRLPRRQELALAKAGVEIDRPRVRARDGGEVARPSWETALSEDLLSKWAPPVSPRPACCVP